MGCPGLPDRVCDRHGGHRFLAAPVRFALRCALHHGPGDRGHDYNDAASFELMTGFQFLNLISAIARLALASDEQARYLDALGAPGGQADELALEFSDAAVLVGPFVEAGWLSASGAAQVERIQETLGAIDGEWKVSDLDSDSWRSVRRLAIDFFVRTD